MTVAHEEEVRAGQRFQFGANWASFLSVLDEERIEEACRSLRDMLGTDSLAGRSFVDVGSGSGLFSLAARRLGAARVHSLDFDPKSVACTRHLKERYDPGNAQWTVEQGSALDAPYLRSLGRFDVVYSWGVLHHTGSMWQALDNVMELVAPGSTLFIAIYRDQGWMSHLWRAIKRLYNASLPTRWLVTAIFCALFFTQGLLADLFRLRNPLRRYAEYKRSRGMSRVHDWIDWIGGLPFEVATPDQILDHCRQRGFTLLRLTTVLGHGCNQFVFARR
jgi:2-polyprenyl-6-hydroxyphenyl methylase/3-demethylubiquinone-9 3-methyltransferase